MGGEPPEAVQERDRHSTTAANMDSRLPDIGANRVAGAPAPFPLPVKKLHPIRQHNLRLAQLRKRQRIAQGVMTLGMLACAAACLAIGGAMGIIAAMGFGLLFLVCCVAFSPWSQRVRRGIGGRRGKWNR
ncbi:MAG: hypothetical protein JWO42_2316 [Chloroflexi bacterium]|jgi:hypothetical protein|nr:hypothetical protein [Chloroflexota bacterium]